ncbi:MAG TPA: DUF192 domain-containing protein [Bacillota bacterium]|jgi:uncharacterized membrane protein (UPF0127 family)|nr:DUF192 domain-containing protein [Bacillota bacterium]HOL10402.1 DUF192 domain-containing protein [Bacillota bacterium]HPO97455.1 DUF192 domain-containing protein [Bacillota bacterium]
MAGSGLVLFRGTEELLSNIRLATTFLTRLRGLMFYQRMPQIDGLLFSPCNSIHTFWMRFAIDVIFMDRSGRILAVYEKLPPNRVTKTIKNAYYVLEAEAGFADRFKVKTGDCLRWEPQN